MPPISRHARKRKWALLAATLEEAGNILSTHAASPCFDQVQVDVFHFMSGHCDVSFPV